MKPDITKFKELYDKIVLRHSYRTVFTEFLDIVICVLAAQRYEDDYFKATARYNKEELELLRQLFHVMVKEMDANGKGGVDVLGEFFEAHITDGKQGQFFTPDFIIDYIVKAVNKEEEAGNITGKHVCDPACGSGRFLVAAALYMGKGNYFYGADIDPACCKMTAINMCLNGVQGEVAWMDSLTNEHWGGYVVYYDPTREYVPTIEKLPANEGVLYNMGLVKLEELHTRVKKERAGKNDDKGKQLNIF